MIQKKSKLLWVVNILFVLTIGTWACKKEACKGSACKIQTVDLPVAEAGTDRFVPLPKDTIQLDGSASHDSLGIIVSYRWTKIYGPDSVKIENDTSAKTVVSSIADGIYIFQLEVKNDQNKFDIDSIRIVARRSCDTNNRKVITTSFSPVGNLSEIRVNAVAGYVGSKILFAGGGYFGIDGCVDASSRVDIYDTSNNSWSTGELASKRWYPATATIGNKVFFAGGYESCISYSGAFSTVDVFDASTNKWSQLQLSAPRMGLAMAAVGNKVLFTGGFAPYPSEVFTSTVDIYDVSSNTWTIAHLSEPRANMTAVTVGNKVYFGGGNTSMLYGTWTFTNPSNTIDIYDNASGQWSVAHLNEAKAWMSAIAIDNDIYWVGGSENAFAALRSQQVEIMDANTKTSRFDCLSEPRSWQFNSAARIGNKIVFNDNANFDTYDISTGIWSIGENLGASSTTIVSVNNTLYVVSSSPSVVYPTVFKLTF